MRTTTSCLAAIGFALLAGACTQHAPPQPTGTGFFAEGPTGVVSALPDHVVAEAQTLAERCEAADFNACARLAWHYEHGLTPRPKASGHGGGDHGDHEEEVALPVDPVKALALYNAACDVGFRTSCLASARLLREGTGAVERAPDTAAQHVKLACYEVDMVEACMLLAETTTSSAERARVLASTCHLGAAEACMAASPQRFY